MYSNMDVEDVGSFHAEPTDDEDRDPYENSRGIPVKGVIPVGSTITASDLSTPGSGSKIVAWDWQVVYYKENDQGKMGDIYDEYYDRTNSNINIPAPTEKGYMIVFLSVGSDYKIFEGARYTSNEHGNWRSLQVKESRYDENPDYILKGWYFTAIKFKVEEVRKLG